MGFNCGIVGLPNVGKSTLFTALSSAKAEVANYPFCTIEPNQGLVGVPDQRLKVITKFIKPQKVIPAQIEFWDIAGLVKGASKGEGLGNQFLGHIRQTNAIVHVVRCFEDGDIVHVTGKVDPLSDIETIDTELMLADLESVTKRFAQVEKLKKTGDKKANLLDETLKVIQKALEAGKNARDIIPSLSPEQLPIVDELHLLTAKPVIFAANLDENTIADPASNQHYVKLKNAFPKNTIVPICGKIESELAEMNEAEREEFLKDLGIQESGLHLLIREGYRVLGLRTYFTAGEKEVRAWTIHEGWKAPQAAGVIHPDFERGFIRAEVFHYEDLIKFGSESAIKDAGKLRVEGKEYIVQDGDIMHFRFNV